MPRIRGSSPRVLPVGDLPGDDLEDKAAELDDGGVDGGGQAGGDQLGVAGEELRKKMEEWYRHKFLKIAFPWS